MTRNLDLPLALALGLGPQERAERLEQALREARLWDEVKGRLLALMDELL